jgi:hypothetical protein
MKRIVTHSLVLVVAVAGLYLVLLAEEEEGSRCFWLDVSAMRNGTARFRGGESVNFLGCILGRRKLSGSFPSQIPASSPGKPRICDDPL